MGTTAIAFVASHDPEASTRFYRDVLGCTLIEETPFATVFDAFGTALRVQKVKSVTAAPYTCFGLEVEDIDAAVRALQGHGVELVRYPGFEQDALGIWTAPGGARVAWFHDPSGNLVSYSRHA